MTAPALADHDRGKHQISPSQLSFVDRHGGLCVWCGETVRLDVTKGHPLAPTREHLTPRALNGKGGANLALAHRRCNELRQHMDEMGFKRLMNGEAVDKYDLWPHLFRL